MRRKKVINNFLFIKMEVEFSDKVKVAALSTTENQTQTIQNSEMVS